MSIPSKKLDSGNDVRYLKYSQSGEGREDPRGSEL